MIHPYSELAYAESISRGDPVVMSETLGAPLRLRAIPGSDLRDASGLYPLSPGLWPAPAGQVRAELKSLGAVSLVLVSDPFEPRPTARRFDLIRAYKSHHVVDPTLGPLRFSKHHRAEVRRALRACTARRIALGDHLDAFIRLYDVLIARHDLGDQHKFGPEHFEHLAAHDERFPTFGAFQDGVLVSAHIWVRHGDRAYSHLAASSAEGYAIGAAYAAYDYALSAQSGCLITLGGTPDGSAGDGLDRFKRGFANAARASHICGVIGDAEAYDALCRKVPPETTFFPRYRG